MPSPPELTIHYVESSIFNRCPELELYIIFVEEQASLLPNLTLDKTSMELSQQRKTYLVSLYK